MLLFRHLRDGLVGGSGSLFPCGKFWKSKRHAKNDQNYHQHHNNNKYKNSDTTDEEFSSTNTEEDLKRLEGSIVSC